MQLCHNLDVVLFMCKIFLKEAITLHTLQSARAQAYRDSRSGAQYFSLKCHLKTFAHRVHILLLCCVVVLYFIVTCKQIEHLSSCLLLCPE